MVQNCCATCMERIGQFVCFILCCKCCCCCCKKKQDPNINIELKDSSTPQTIFGNIDDDESIYNGSSIYDSNSVIKQQPYSEAGTSGVFMSEGSLYSGSITENKKELHIEFKCEIKGIVQIGGVEQPVKGILNIVPDENDNRQPVKKSIYAVNPTLGDEVLRNKNRSEVLQKEKTISKTPQPLPRVKETDINYVNTDEEKNEELYDLPKPPLPIKTKKIKDPSMSYDPVYENMEWNLKDTRPSNQTSTADDLYNILWKNSTVDIMHTDEDTTDDHIYEDIDPSYYIPDPKYQHNSSDSKREDYEIYMS